MRDFEDSLRMGNHGIHNITEVDQHFSIVMKFLVGPFDKPLDVLQKLGDGKLLEIVDDVAKVNLKNDIVQADILQFTQGNRDGLGVGNSIFCL